MQDAYYDEESATFGDRMAAAREEAGLGAPQLAQKLGVKTQTIAAWETDRAEPRANQLQTLAGVLGVSMKWLMTGIGDGVAPPPDAHRDATLALLLGELREARMAQARAAEKLARIETRLQALAAGG